MGHFYYLTLSCRAIQWNGFYMISASVMKELHGVKWVNKTLSFFLFSFHFTVSMSADVKPLMAGGNKIVTHT